MEPALLACPGSARSQYAPYFSSNLDLVALVEVADLRATQLVGRVVSRRHDPIADDLSLATVEGSDETCIEGQARRRDAVADRIGLAPGSVTVAGASAA